MTRVVLTTREHDPLVDTRPARVKEGDIRLARDVNREVTF